MLEEENKSLKSDIMEVLDGLLNRPEMFVGNSIFALENQFFTLITLIAPYAFDMTARDAGEKIIAYLALVSEKPMTIAHLEDCTDDIKMAAEILKRCYQENFECYTRCETLHWKMNKKPTMPFSTARGMERSEIRTLNRNHMGHNRLSR